MLKITLIASLFTLLPLYVMAQTGSSVVHNRALGAATLLSRYIQYDSETGEEGPAGAFLAARCKEKGLYVEVFSDATDSYNFAASLYPLDLEMPNIILLNHIDVVPVARNTSRWTYPPYAGIIADSMVWGRGALDNKGMAIMQLFALAELVDEASRAQFPYNVTLLSVSSEETGGKMGAKLVTTHFLDKLNPVLVLGEGGSGLKGVLASDLDRLVFGIETAQKQGLQLKLHLQVPSTGHGSVPPEEYANKEMVQALGRLLERKPRIRITKPAAQMFRALGQQETGIRGFALRHPWMLKLFGKRQLRQDPLIRSLVTNTVTVTGIASPNRGSNQIPQRITATLDCRLLPGTSQDDFIIQLKSALREKDMEIEVVSAFVQAAPSDPADPFFGLLKETIRQVYPRTAVVPILFPASNDNNYFRAQGVPSFGLLPVPLDIDLISSIHNTDERIPVTALELGKKVYVNFLRVALLNIEGKSTRYSTIR